MTTILWGGYGKSNKNLDNVIFQVAERSGIILDSTYSGKAWFGMCDYIQSERIKKHSNVLFWHTGGLLNFLA